MNRKPLDALTLRFAAGSREPAHFPNSRPRDASTLILIDRTGSAPKVLIGRRHSRHKFMPGKFVFPGGRVEPSDRGMEAATPLHPAVEARLMRATSNASRNKARGLALAAIRETFEETGFLLGTRRPDAPQTAPGPWAAFAQAHVQPDLSALHFVARAITPPRRARRFDTRFFVADAQCVAHRIDGVVGPDAELVELIWVPIAQAQRLDIPTITSVVLEDLEARIAAGLSHGLEVPFYREQFKRRLRIML